MRKHSLSSLKSKRNNSYLFKMMKKNLLTAIFSIGITIISWSGMASNLDTAFVQANHAYQEGHFEEAINLYTGIVNDGNEGSVLFYNLGNAYYKTGELAHALLWYERALRLAPSNEDIKHNINFVNQQLVDKIEVLPEFALTKWWNNLSRSMTSTSWAIVSIALCFILFILIAMLLLSSRQWLRSTSFIIAFIVFIMVVFSTIFAYKESVRYERQPEAIIMKSVVTAKSTPTLSGSDLFVIHEGLKVGITDKVGSWYEIKLPNGEKGWIDAEGLEII